MAVAGKVSSSFAMIAAAGLGALCLGAPKLLAQDAQPPMARAPAAPKTKPQKNGAAQKPSPVAGAQRPSPATPPTNKQGAPAKAPAPQAAPKAAPAPPAQAKLPPLPPIDTSTPPPTLPRASRERMRACAEEWAKLKRGANANLPMWRDFATGCLTR
jgi:hypothetical protein